MREPWVARSFAFDLPIERIGVLLSRLRGTASRIAASVRTLPRQALVRRPGERWSIQEHVGHLDDLDALHLTRLEELARGVETLTAADMTNRATWAARHNERPFATVLAGFVQSRARLLDAFVRLDAEGLARAALHPRLRQPMRAVDVAFFTAEHDDNHVAAIEELAAAAADLPPPPAVSAAWRDLPHDAPMPLLERRRLVGSEAMLSYVTLHEGCAVPSHSHPNEQFACVLSGKVRFTLADGERVLGAGEVLHLPSRAPHAAAAIEAAVVLDVFAPPSEATGIDQPTG